MGGPGSVAAVSVTRGRRVRPRESFQVWAAAQGWTVDRRAWPEFFCARAGETMVVMTRSTPHRRIPPARRRILACLEAAGIPCYRWDQTTQVLAGPFVPKKTRRLHARIDCVTIPLTFSQGD